MKKTILALLLAMVLPISASAYSPYGSHGVAVDVTARGGYNFLEKSPIAGGAVGVNIWGFRAEFELGWTRFKMWDQDQKDLFYLAPMVGYCYSWGHDCYAMFGVSNWGSFGHIKDYYPEYAWKDTMCGKLKIGGNFFLSEHFFINVEASYMFPFYSRYYGVPVELIYQGFNLCAGVGVRF